MIQLATDPNASRANWRPAAAEAKDNPSAMRRRGGHAWPFISRQAERASTQPATQRSHNPDSGS